MAGDAAMNVTSGQAVFAGFDNPAQIGLNVATSAWAAYCHLPKHSKALGNDLTAKERLFLQHRSEYAAKLLQPENRPLLTRLADNYAARPSDGMERSLLHQDAVSRAAREEANFRQQAERGMDTNHADGTGGGRFFTTLTDTPGYGALGETFSSDMADALTANERLFLEHRPDYAEKLLRPENRAMLTRLADNYAGKPLAGMESSLKHQDAVTRGSHSSIQKEYKAQIETPLSGKVSFDKAGFPGRPASADVHPAKDPTPAPWYRRIWGHPVSRSAKADLEGFVYRVFGGDIDRFNNFIETMNNSLPGNVRVVIKGSAVNGFKWISGRPFDTGAQPSDLDIILTGQGALDLWTTRPGFLGKTSMIAGEEPDSYAYAPALESLVIELERQTGRSVNIAAMHDVTFALRQALQHNPYLVLIEK